MLLSNILVFQVIWSLFSPKTAIFQTPCCLEWLPMLLVEWFSFLTNFPLNDKFFDDIFQISIFIILCVSLFLITWQFVSIYFNLLENLNFLLQIHLHLEKVIHRYLAILP